MRRVLLFMMAILLVVSLSGCFQGIIYSDVTLPESWDMDKTPVGDDEGRSSLNQLREPITSARIAAQWNSKAIGDAYKRGKLARGYYADIQTQSAIFETWKRERILVWGKKRADAEDEVSPDSDAESDD